MKILKLGGSFITKKSGYREVDSQNLQKAAKAVSSIWKKGIHDFILVHGAGSFGHPLVLRYGINNGIRTDAQKKGYADTHASCVELSNYVVRALTDEGVPAISLPPAEIVVQKNKRIAKFDTKKVYDCLKNGSLPILFGDMVPDSELFGSVCSGDQIISYLGKDAEFIVLATNVDGVLDDNGAVIPKITPANFSEIKKHLKKTAGDVTGAMEGKLKEIMCLDAPSYIVNGAFPERIEALMLGKKAVCTEVRKE